MRLLPALIAVLTFLAACDSPHPKMYGADATRLEVEGTTFSVRTKGDIAEAIRIGYAPRKEHPRIILRAVVAMELASGCSVRQGSVRGDPALVVGRLNCTKAPP